jgi:hypothetical protein
MGQDSFLEPADESALASFSSCLISASRFMSAASCRNADTTCQMITPCAPSSRHYQHPAIPCVGGAFAQTRLHQRVHASAGAGSGRHLNGGYCCKPTVVDPPVKVVRHVVPAILAKHLARRGCARVSSVVHATSSAAGQRGSGAAGQRAARRPGARTVLKQK